MSVFSQKIIKDTQDLIYYYNRNPKFKKVFLNLVENDKALFRGKPLKLYLKVATSITPLLFQSYYHKNLSEVKNSLGKDSNSDYFYRLYHNVKEFEKFQQKIAADEPAISKEQDQVLEKIEAISDKNQRVAAHLKNIEKEEKEIKFSPTKKESDQKQEKDSSNKETVSQEKQIDPSKPSPIPNSASIIGESIPTIKPSLISRPIQFLKKIPLIKNSATLPSFKPKLPNSNPSPLSSTAKNISSNVQIKSAVLAARYLTPMRIASAVGGAVGATVGLGMGGGSAVLLGTLAGGFAPMVIKSRLGGLLSPAGGIINSNLRSPQNPALLLAQATPVGRAVTLTRYVLPAIGIFLLMFFILMSGGGMNLLNTTSILTTQIAEGSPLEGPSTQPGNFAGGGDITQCTFYREGDGANNGRQFKSPLLLSYIQEASEKSNIPPQVLAAFIRIEQGSALNMSDQQIQNYQCIYSGPGQNVSQDGAIGIMQIISRFSHRTDAYCEECVNQGAKYIGKTAATLTQEELCSPRTNVIIGAGFILGKMNALGYRNNGSWNSNWTFDKAALDALAKGYYGCHKYTSCENKDGTGGGPFDYGDDLYKSVTSCQVVSPTNAPIPTILPGADLASEISKNFHITFTPGKFNQNHLKWAWEVLSQAKQNSPRFFDLFGNVTVDTQFDTGERKGNTIYFSTKSNSFFSTADEAGFKILLIHELGHVIRGDTGKFDQPLQAAIDKDGGYLTGYGQNYRVTSGGTRVACYGTLSVDEDFAESIAYYINRGTSEKDLGCGRKSFDGVNPMYSGKYPNHLNFIKSILNP